MPTVIDALLVTLGFDTKGMAAGSAQARTQLKAIGEGAAAAGKVTDAATKSMVDGYRRVRNEVLSLFALVTAGRGLRTLIGDITSGDAALGRLATRLGTSTEELSNWQQAVQRTGGTAEGFAQTAERLTNAYQQQRITGINPLVAYYRALGVSMTDARGRMVPVTDQLRQMSEYAQRTHMSPAEGSAFFGNMGIDQGTINLIMQGPRAVDEMLRRTRELGLVSERDARNAQRLQRQLADIRQGFESLLRTALNDLSPTIMKILGQMTRWLRANRAWLAQKIDEYVKRFVEFLKHVPQYAGQVADAIDRIKDAVGGWVRVSEVLFGMWAVSRLAGLAGAARAFGAALTVAAAGGGAAGAAGGGGGAAVGFGLGAALRFAGRNAPWAAFLTTLLSPTPANAGEDELVRRRRAEGWAGAGGNFGTGPDRIGFTPAEREDLRVRFQQFQEEFQRALLTVVANGTSAEIGSVAGRALGAQPYDGGLGADPSRHPDAGKPVNSTAAERESYDYWIGRGFTPAGASAMVAQEEQESGFDPAARGDYVGTGRGRMATAFGSFQWHGNRADAILRRTGIDVRTAGHRQQLDAMYYEMSLGLDAQSGQAYLPIRNATDAYRAGAIGSALIERPADRLNEMARRGGRSQQWYRFHQQHPDASRTIAPISGAPVRSPMDLRPTVNNTTVGQVNVHTSATDADGISRDINRALQRRLVPIQADTGLR